MQTKIKYAKNLTPLEYKQCKSLNFRQSGDMLYALPRARNNGSRVIMIHDGEQLVAWALLVPYTNYYEGQFYVRASYRRRGLGKRLIKKALKIHPDIRICPHDYRSAAFFASVDEDLLPVEDYKQNYDQVKRLKNMRKRLTKSAA